MTTSIFRGMFFPVFLAALISVFNTLLLAAEKTRPNIVCTPADDLGWADLAVQAARF
jgi:hypothetical protein